VAEHLFMNIRPDALNSSNALACYSPADTAGFQNLFAAIVAAARAIMQQQQDGGRSRYERVSGQGTQRPNGPCDSSGRGMPNITGNGNGCAPDLSAMRGHCKNGGFDFASFFVKALFEACPTPPPVDCGTPPPVVTPTVTPPVDCGTPPPVDCETPPPVDCEPPAAAKKVFIVGDIVQFGRSDGTVRGGLKQLLEAATNPNKKQKKTFTNGTLSEEDQGKLRALLESNDPEVKKMLSKKVPKKKSLVIGEDGNLVATLNTKNEIITNTSLNVGDHKGGRIDRSAGGQLEIGGQTYDVAGTELHSPIKIALDGKDAKLDSKHGFSIDLNGFKEKGGVQKTSGGLNANEAWLVRDRAGDGIVKNGVVDGDDVYGDHNGVRKDGYDDLARDFASEIKTDAKTGKRYIDLTAPGSKAATELKLLDASGQLRPARDVLNRIEVDGAAANERDAKGNVITARAGVTFKDGHVATSADQWFRTAV